MSYKRSTNNKRKGLKVLAFLSVLGAGLLLAFPFLTKNISKTNIKSSISQTKTAKSEKSPIKNLKAPTLLTANTVSFLSNELSNGNDKNDNKLSVDASAEVSQTETSVSEITNVAEQAVTTESTAVSTYQAAAPSYAPESPATYQAAYVEPTVATVNNYQAAYTVPVASSSGSSSIVLANGNTPGAVGSAAAAEMARLTGVPQSTWEYIIARESNGNPNAANPSGASGLFQTMPGWGSTATVADQINSAYNAYNTQGLGAWGY